MNERGNKIVNGTIAGVVLGSLGLCIASAVYETVKYSRNTLSSIPPEGTKSGSSETSNQEDLPQYLTPLEVLTEGWICSDPLESGEWPLKKIRELRGQPPASTVPAELGPYAIIRNNGTFVPVPDYGYIGDVFPGEKICVTRDSIHEQQDDQPDVQGLGYHREGDRVSTDSLAYDQRLENNIAEALNAKGYLLPSTKKNDEKLIPAASTIFDKNLISATGTVFDAKTTVKAVV